jgi:hypothetical protein
MVLTELRIINLENICCVAEHMFQKIVLLHNEIHSVFGSM